jgi:uncharacterized protein (UPF0303 family)
MTDAELYQAILAEERELTYPVFTHGEAWELGSMMRAEAMARGLELAIGIRLGRQTVFQTALPRSSANNNAWVERKLNVVEFFAHASFAVGALYRSQAKDFATQSGLDQSQFSAYGGGFPLRVGATLVGGVAVSGLPQAEDHAFVVELLRIHRGGRGLTE